MDQIQVATTTKEMALEYFVAGIEESATGDVVRGTILLDTAITTAEGVDQIKTDDQELDFLNHAIVVFAHNTYALNDDAAAEYVMEIVPPLMNRIADWVEAQF